EPSWWLWWYPSARRRRGNVWDRLPAAARYVRTSVFAFIIYCWLIYVDIGISKVVFGVRHMEPHFIFGGGLESLQTRIALAILAAISASLFFIGARVRRTLTRQGLAPADINRVMLTMPPSRVSFWARPHIAVILAPAGETRRASDSPHDDLQAILRDGGELSGPLRPLGGQAAVAARQLIESIEHADRQIAELARNIEPGEEERLADKIEALAGVAESAPMRSLLEKQLDLVRQLSSRIEEAKEKRNRRVEMLRSLALHVASLRARTVPTPSEVSRISDNVRALCDDIAEQAMALDSVAAGHGGEQATVERSATS
ncbi:MAG TPA: hypothetical protein VGK31_10045, partial [Thermoanaerobaculia bacterium]